ncbi:hypothetical protein EAH68_13150 [Corynebacterium hylobatis]|uniref:Uncharacterized protein n=1 Tax=Corynebacterium hylobatis TaxID=1859290 RepID=A0A3S0BEQ8_9CORY|nr:hypothetical protein [Corynebacterium hylobatis]RSZ61411.1 hypothetical protein EAH68_13150 [Corynebacterium hylobatis]
MVPIRTAIVISAALLLSGCAASTDSASPTSTDPAVLSVVPAANTTTTVIAGSCEESAFLDVFDAPVVLFCDGAWAEAGQQQTDAILLFQFRDGGWQIRQADGNSWPSNYPCHNEAALRADGAPEALIGQTLLCDSPAL